MDKSLHNKPKNFLSRFFFILILLSFSSALLISFLFNHKKEAPFTILFTGDILLSRNVKMEIESKKQSPWIYLDSLFKSSDLLIGNLEGTISDSSSIKTDRKNKSPEFIIPSNFTHFLKDAGFDILISENNHSHDLLEKGIISTKTELIKAGLKEVNFENSPVFYEKENLIISFVAINQIPGKDSVIQTIPSPEVLQKIRVAKSLSNLVVVYIHWGNELNTWPNDSQISSAKWLTKNGADLIIGSHPHVIQNPAIVNGKIVFYSLGNHLFDQKYIQTKEGLVAECKITGGYLECDGILTATEKGSFFPKRISSESYNLTKVPLRNTTKVNNISLKPNQNSNGNNKILLRAHKDKMKLWESFSIDIRSLEVFHLEGKGECLFVLEKHYSPLDKETSLRPYVYSISEKRITSLWRGSALAYPILDATFLPNNSSVLCVLHRGDSFLQLNPKTTKTKILSYKWNGFGFSGISDESKCKECEEYFNSVYRL